MKAYSNTMSSSNSSFSSTFTSCCSSWMNVELSSITVELFLPGALAEFWAVGNHFPGQWICLRVLQQQLRQLPRWIRRLTQKLLQIHRSMRLSFEIRWGWPVFPQYIQKNRSTTLQQMTHASYRERAGWCGRWRRRISAPRSGTSPCCWRRGWSRRTFARGKLLLLFHLTVKNIQASVAQANSLSFW